MICNVSRLQTFLECRQKDKYLWEDHLIPNRTPTPLLTGSAVHKGLEIFFKTDDVGQAVTELEKEYRDRVGQMSFVLQEEQAIYEKEIRFSKMAMELWAENYRRMGFQVLYPEVTFCEALKGTTHHCFFMHRILHPDEPENGCTDTRCVMSHMVKGRGDGIVEKQGKIWLLETKTAGATGNPYYDQWHLDMQPTAYLWGMSKALGIKLNGFILNVIKKPAHNFKGSLEDHFAKAPFEQEAFVRTEEDLERFEVQTAMMFEERERAHREGIIYMSPRRATCVAYNRRCHFFDLCQRHGEQLAGEFMQKPLDYVEEEYLTRAGLPIPAKPPQGLTFELPEDQF